MRQTYSALRDALRGAMQAEPPKEAKPKKRRKAKARKAKKTKK